MFVSKEKYSNEIGAEFFGLVNEILKGMATPTTEQMYSRKSALFMALVCRMDVVRDTQTPDDTCPELLSQLRLVIDEIKTHDADSASKPDPLFAQLLVMEFEIAFQRQEWSHISSMLENTGKLQSSMKILERFSDIAVHSQCPEEISYLTLKVHYLYLENSACNASR